MTAPLSHILYIDDEADILEIAGMCLEGVGGYRVSSSSNGEDGFKLAMAEKPDLILLDVMMPVIDGPATLQKIHSHPDLANIPVIFMTARVQPENIEKYMSMGAIGVIEKPFDPMTLADQVQNLWKNAHDR